jgi:hypothetical protein
MEINFPLSSKARRCGSGWIDVCPAHDDHSPSLSIDRGADGKLLLHCFTGCSFEDIVAAAGLANIPIASHADLKFLEKQRLADQQRKRNIAKRIWDSCVSLAGTPSEAYLASRGVATRSPMLRHHPSLWHEERNISCPALVAAVQQDNAFTGIHRTFLTEDGDKLDRKMLGPCRGGSVHLTPYLNTLVVAEGIETALSVMVLHANAEAGYWAGLSSAGVARLILPRRAGALIVAADGDDTGRKAASELAQRASLAGWSAHIVQAPEGKDFNDLLQERSHETV